MKQKNGFIFIETIIVTCMLLASLMIIFAMYITSLNNENRRLRYDDPAKIYETYYLKRYLESFSLDTLKNNLKNGTSKSEVIYRGRRDIFGDNYSEETMFFEDLWTKLNIRNIYFVSAKVSDFVSCDNTNGLESICSNPNLLMYLNTIDDGASDEYILIVEYASKRDGTSCTSDTCTYYFSHILVGDESD